MQPPTVTRTTHVFDRIASRYDMMNTLMSLGQDQLWRRIVLGYIPWEIPKTEPQKPLSIVDMACGTGTLSTLIIHEAERRNQSLLLWMMDPSQAMLDQIPGTPHHQDTQVHIVHACAEDVPLACHSVDVYVCAFGLRNMEDRTQAMQEAHRILRPQGTLIILEFSPDVSPLSAIPYAYYLNYVIPWLGKHVAQDEAAYRYLSESIAAFPSPITITTELAVIGFQSLYCIPISSGVVQLYYGKRSHASPYQRRQLCGSTL